MADDVDREWFIAAAFQLQTAADELWDRVQRYHAELLKTMGLRPPEVSAFDREYFRQKMAEARQRRHDEHMRHVGEMLADQSEPLILDDPPQLDAIPGLAEALDGFVGSSRRMLLQYCPCDSLILLLVFKTYTGHRPSWMKRVQLGLISFRAAFINATVRP